VRDGNVASASNVRTFAMLSLLTADTAFGFPPKHSVIPVSMKVGELVQRYIGEAQTYSMVTA
jgi:hypothetical protein